MNEQTTLMWDQQGEKFYETGTKNGVVYPMSDDGKTYQAGVAWSGLTAVSESPSGAEETPLYADDQKYLSLTSAEEFGATIEAYTYPDVWEECDGSASLASGITTGQQTRRPFGFSYVTTLGNDGMGNDFGYKLHLIYNAKASPSEKSYSTINDSPEAITFSWTLTTTPIDMPAINGKKLKKSATLTIEYRSDGSKISRAAMDAIEAKLYGDGSEPAKLLMPSEILEIVNASVTYTPVSSSIEGYSSKNPATEQWYERSGSEGSYVYTLTTDTTVDEEKTYYQRS